MAALRPRARLAAAGLVAAPRRLLATGGADGEDEDSGSTRGGTRTAPGSYVPRNFVLPQPPAPGRREPSVRDKPPRPAPAFPPVDGKRKVMLGMMLFRKPVVVPERHPFERAYNEWKWQLEKEEAEPVIKEFWTKTTQSKELDEAEAERLKEEQTVKAYPRVTNADRTNDMRSLKRKLDDVLYFVVRTQPDGPYAFPEWEPPSDRLDFTKYNEEKVIQLYRPPTGFRFWFPAYHPSAVRVEAEKETYLYVAMLMSGHPTVERAPGHVDHLWLNKRELYDVLPRDYFMQVKDMLFTNRGR